MIPSSLLSLIYLLKTCRVLGGIKIDVGIVSHFTLLM